MRRTTTVAQLLVRGCGLFQIVTGLLFWTGRALSLIPWHMLSGLALSLALLALGVLGIRAGVHPGRALLAIAWALGVPVLGVTQGQLLPGDLHWIVQVAHLLVGLVAMWLAGGLAEAIRGRLAARGQPLRPASRRRVG